MCESEIIIVRDKTEKKRKLKIAIDFDDTISADPEMWFEIMCLMFRYGHDVRIVTARWDVDGLNLDIRTFLMGSEEDFPVIYCGGVQKAAKCKYLGWEPDIWCDDFPAGIPMPPELVNRAKELGLM